MSEQEEDRAHRSRTTPNRPRARRRGATLEEAILSAAVDELVAKGYAGMSMDGIARRAGTNKNAIYRRWPTRAAIGMAAYHRLSSAEAQPPETGKLREDVLEMLRRANRRFSTPNSHILRDLLSSLGSDPELQVLFRELSADAGAADWIEILRHALARGEVRPEALDPRVATVAIVLLRNEYVTRGEATVPDSVLVEITDKVFLPLVKNQ